MPLSVRRSSRPRPARVRRAGPLPWPLILGGIAIAAVLVGGGVYVLTRPSGDAERSPSSTSTWTRPIPPRPPRPPIQVNYSDREVARLARQLDAEQIRTRTAAAKTLAGMGPRAKEAMPALLEALGRPAAGIEFERAVGQAIQAIGPAALPELLTALKSNDTQTRTCAATALGKIGPSASGAVQALIGALESDRDYGVRSSAAAALGAIGPGAKAALPALKRAAGSPMAKLTDNPADSELRVRARMAIDQIRAAP